MSTKFTQSFSWLKNHPKTSVPFFLGSLVLTSVLLFGYSTGPGDGGLARTGAPFVQGGLYCTQCHNGGNFGASITLELLDAGNNVVTLYNPGETYTYRITLGHTSGNPQYGFQTMAALADANHTDLNTWGTPPANTHSVIVTPNNEPSRHYIEHSSRLTNNIISIPWTAPAANSGTVEFYAAGNIVNANFGTSGDQAVKTSLSIAENTGLPVRLSFFNGGLQNGAATLSWEAATESGSKSYTVERSIDGRTFIAIATIAAKNEDGSSYSFTDAGFTGIAYYRLSHTDLDGNTTLYNTVRLKKAGLADYSISFYSHGNFKRILFMNDVKEQRIQVRVADISGRVLYTTSIRANLGSNMIPVPAIVGKGILVVSVLTEDGKQTSAKTISQ
jgi:hypothetical protein